MRLPLHSKTAIGGVLLGADWLLSKAEHVDFVTGHLAASGPVMNFLRAIDFSAAATWALVLVGSGLIVSDWWPKPNAARSSEAHGYMSVSDAIDYIANLSHWSKTEYWHRQYSSEEFRRAAELGEVETIGLRSRGQFGFGLQKIPSAHWNFSVFPQQRDMPGSMADFQWGTETLVPGISTYRNIMVRQRDVYRAWPKDRWWHKLRRAIASQR
jgi:hypothetical protein